MKTTSFLALLLATTLAMAQTPTQPRTTTVAPVVAAKPIAKPATAADAARPTAPAQARGITVTTAKLVYVLQR